jgi:hypothetical protein
MKKTKNWTLTRLCKGTVENVWVFLKISQKTGVLVFGLCPNFKGIQKHM